MSAIHDVDLSTYCGRIGNLYMRRGLCPPFILRQVATDWKATGIALSHVVAVIDRHLTDHRRRYYSGSGDALFTWLDEVVRKTWYEQQVSAPKAQSSRPKMQREPNLQCVDQQPGANHEIGTERRPISREATACSRPDILARGRTDQTAPQPAKSIGQTRKQPNRIDEAIGFLRRELANGEVVASRLEMKARASGISPRTLDRARARLKVVSRRTGFAKKGKCWCSLPTTP
jgi:hypothetical protein